MQTDVTDIIRLEREERSRMMDDHTALIRATTSPRMLSPTRASS